MHQLTISFEVHRFENNPISQAHLDAHREHFGNDVYEVLRRLVAGERLSVREALNNGLSGDLRARMRDLRKIMQIPVSDEWVKTDSGRAYKVYFMTESDKIEALKVLMNKMEKAA